jgi:3'-phosphoadenosine 5'-phosphosulfate (PAPS) 3'-phosphatase
MNNKNKYPLLTQIVASAVNISQKSAKILYEVKQSGELNITEKKDEYDVVTRADFLSQLNIIKSIEHLFPKVKIWGEEGDLNDTYDDIETSLNENVLNEAEFLPDVYNELREEDVIYILNIIFKFYIFLI